MKTGDDNTEECSEEGHEVKYRQEIFCAHEDKRCGYNGHQSDRSMSASPSNGSAQGNEGGSGGGESGGGGGQVSYR